MSGQASRLHERPWPPVIVAENTPRWVKWRDFMITLMMWMLFSIMLDDELELFVNRQLARLNLGVFRTDPNWVEHFRRLTPYAIVGVVLVGLLVVASLATLRRRRRTLLLPPPPPLSLAEEASRCGMDEAKLAVAKDLPVAVVHIGTDGGYRVEPRHAPG